MKKFLILLLTILISTMAFIGCDSSVEPLKNTDGEVLSGNGSFFVEKGDYFYFINGKESNSKNNELGKPVKGALVRIKKDELNKGADAKVEMVLPKLLVSNSYKSGFYMYGNYVYYATPSTVKDKQGEVKYEETEFNKFNLKTGEVGSPIAYATEEKVEYKYILRNDKVYLAYTYTKTEDETEKKYFKVFNASDNKLVFTSPAYTEMLMPEDNSASIFYTVYSEGVSKDELASFQDVYRYNVGDKKAELVVSGSGSANIESNGRNELDNSVFLDFSGILGSTISLIKNTGKILVFKASTLDSTNLSSHYYGVNLNSENCKFVEDENRFYLGASSELTTDKAFASTSIYVSLDEIYFIDNTDGSSAGLFKFDYKKCSEDEGGLDQGKTRISDQCKGYSIQFVEGDYMYLANTANGTYYRCNYKGEDVKVKKINAVKIGTQTEWFKPTVWGNYFIGLGVSDYYKNYVCFVDMTDIDLPCEAGEEKTPYELELDKYSDLENATKEDMLILVSKRLGKITSADKKAIDELIEENYGEENE